MLQVNRPKYSRTEPNRKEWNSNLKQAQQRKVWRKKQSYVQAVKGGRQGIRADVPDKNIYTLSEMEGTIQKGINDNRVRFEGIFESIRLWDNSFVVEGKLVVIEIDEKMLAMEELEFAKICVRMPVGREAFLVKHMRINDTLCQGQMVQGPKMVIASASGGTCNLSLKGERASRCSYSYTEMVRHNRLEEKVKETRAKVYKFGGATGRRRSERL
ncbi:hypothetical protein VNO80_07423 [Phaseolus coccineus]|uniref:Uncharacterized protein n=1 Tax=Phaseolus coccineus TaxID=3886 RepID=A0AAN9RFD6_PHACN